MAGVSPESSNQPDRTVVSFVRRSPRMTASQRTWLGQYADRWLVPFIPASRANLASPQPPLDLPAIFGRPAPLVVEIGSGHGETLVAAALAQPERDFLGFEVFDAGLGATLGQLAAQDLTNVRLIRGEAVTGLTHLLPPGSITELWVFFPDPWPKKRHHKRRLINPTFTRLASDRLVPGGRLRLATDWDDYADTIAAVMAVVQDFHLTSTERFVTRPLTRFEKRGLTAGRTIHDFSYEKAAP